MKMLALSKITQKDDDEHPPKRALSPSTHLGEEISMKKTIVTFGLISGAVSSAMMLLTMPFMDRIGFERGYFVGYTSIVLSFLLVFFGIRSYRDNVGAGQITFGKAFMIGLGITVISCVCYVITWEVLYFTVMHDFMDKYAAYVIGKAKSSGATEAVLQQKMQQMAQAKKMYNPFINVAYTFVEPFPVGLVITLVSAALLKKRTPTQATALAG